MGIPTASAAFVCGMEEVPDVYERPYEESHLVVCLDESPRQLISETRSGFMGKEGIKAALYEIFNAQQARSILRRIVFAYTPKHGSWLNMAEIELNVLNRVALKQRIGTK